MSTIYWAEWRKFYDFSPSKFHRDRRAFEYESLGKQQIFELFIRIVPSAPVSINETWKIYTHVTWPVTSKMVKADLLLRLKHYYFIERI